MAGTRDNVHLLFAGKVDKLDRISRNADGEVCIFFLFGVFHGVDQLFLAKNVNVQMVCALVEISVEYLCKVAGSFVLVCAQRVGVYGLGVGNAVQGVLVGQLGNGVQRGDEAGLLRTVAGVGTGGQRGPGPAGPARKLSSPS